MTAPKDRYGMIMRYQNGDQEERFRVLLDLTETDDLFTLKMLFRHFDSIEVQNEDTTLLHAAASQGAKKILKFILDSDLIDINTRDAMKRTALHLAILAGSIYCVKMLLDHGINVNAVSDNGMTARSLARSSKQPDIIHLITLASPKR